MSASIGNSDEELFATGWESLLHATTRIQPEASGNHVRLDVYARVRSTQRLALARSGDGVVVGLWPAELKSQAEDLYDEGRAVAMIDAARERGWNATANPHVAFWNARPSERLYLNPDVDAREYARRWEGADGRRIGEYSRDEVRRALWPWLKERGYAAADDDEMLDLFMEILGRRGAHLRAGLRLEGRWDAAFVAEREESAVAAAIRREVNAILGAAGEPHLS